jgi:hypothetical protein
VKVYAFRPPGQLARGLQILLALIGGLTLVTDVWVWSVLRTGTFVLHTPPARSGQFEPSYWTGTMLPGLTWLPGTLSWAVIIVWLVWQHQATANLWARGYPGLKTSPGWSVGWWFIPFANLVMPLIAMLELDRRSTPNGSERPTGAVLGWWWGALIAYWVVPAVGAVGAVSGAISDLVRQVDAQGGQVTQIDFTAAAHALAPWLVVSGVLQAVAAALAIAVVRRVDAAQRSLTETTGSAFLPVPARPDSIA